MRLCSLHDAVCMALIKVGTICRTYNHTEKNLMPGCDRFVTPNGKVEHSNESFIGQ